MKDSRQFKLLALFLFTYIYHTVCYCSCVNLATSCPLDTVEDTCPSPGTLRTGLQTPPAGSLPPSTEAHGMPYRPSPWPNFSSGSRPSPYYQSREAVFNMISTKQQQVETLMFYLILLQYVYFLHLSFFISFSHKHLHSFHYYCLYCCHFVHSEYNYIYLDVM